MYYLHLKMCSLNESNESDVNMISNRIVRDVVFYTAFTNFTYS